MASGNFLNHNEEQRLADEIFKLERHTSAEVRIHVLNKVSKHGILHDAATVFQKLKMTETKNKNGVLICVALKDRQVTCLGDKNAHDKIGDQGWSQIIELITGHFKKGDYYLGLHSALSTLGEWLKIHFPGSEENHNELPNTISKSDVS